MASNMLHLVESWSSYRYLTAEDRLVFNKTLSKFSGLQYVPEKVAIQFVEGVKYRFKCSVTMPLIGVVYLAIVEILVTLNGEEPFITLIERI